MPAKDDLLHFTNYRQAGGRRPWYTLNAGERHRRQHKTASRGRGLSLWTGVAGSAAACLGQDQNLEVFRYGSNKATCYTESNDGLTDIAGPDDWLMTIAIVCLVPRYRKCDWDLD